MIVYHYTTKDAYDRITKTRELRPSDPWTTLDAAYGYGWYFTDLDPKTCHMAISFYSWRQTVLERVKYYLAFDIDVKLLQKTRKYVYMLPLNKIPNGIINLGLEYTQEDRLVIKFRSSSSKEYCSQEPCETCEVGKRYNT